MKSRILLVAILLASACTHGPRQLTVLTTDDVHGAWFDSTYTGNGTRNSLMAVNYYVDSIRRAEGQRNVLLLDAGDCIQGDNAAYYYNYMDTTGEHLFSRLAAYMKYDAVIMGNHDLETGPAVYRKVERELASHGIPFMAANALSDSTGLPVFTPYKVFRRAGMKVLVLGYQNPNIAAWLDRSLWPGMHFESLIPLVQKDADYLREAIKPDVTIAVVHSGVGKGDGKVLEDQALDLFKSLRGVDLVVCGHDHRQIAMCADSIGLLNTGSRARYLGIGKITLASDGSKKVETGLLKVDKSKADPAMREAFRADFEAVRAFTNEEIGLLSDDILTREAYAGRCPYTDLLHRVQLEASGAELSFAAPLTFNGKIAAGVLTNGSLFTIYPYENDLCTIRMSGREIKRYMEYDYGRWLAEPGSGHALAIHPRGDARYYKSGWAFVYSHYNLDSVGGLVYTVDLRKPTGSRITIKSLAGGRPFSEDAYYTVAVTSYRASGGGQLLTRGAGIPKEELESRVVGHHGNIRAAVKAFIGREGVIDPDSIWVPALGDWKFVPDGKAVEKDMELLFGK